MNAHMIIGDIQTFSLRLADHSALIGLDLGKKTIGMAISDDGRKIASALNTIRRTRFTQDAEFLLNIAVEYGVGGFILGLPLNMNGTEGPRCQSVRQFASNLSEKTDIPMAFWDERLSTQAVERHLIARDVSRKRRAKVIDKLAAQFILQGALDFMRNIEH